MQTKVLATSDPTKRFRVAMVICVIASLLWNIFVTQPAFAGGGPLIKRAVCVINKVELPISHDGVSFWQEGATLSGVKFDGGTCVVETHELAEFSYNSSQGRKFIDGKPLHEGKGRAIGTKLTIEYDRDNRSNGFDGIVRPAGSAPLAPSPLVSLPAPAGSELRGSCTFAGNQWDLRTVWDHPNGARLDMDNAMLAAGKALLGGTQVPCHWVSSWPYRFEMGGITTLYPAGEVFPVVTGGQGFGFALQTNYMSSTPSPSPAPATSVDLRTSLIGPGIPDPNGTLSGSCTINGTMYLMSVDPWHPQGTRLFMSNPMVAAGKVVTGKIPCMFGSPRPATVEIAGQRLSIPGGKAWYFEVDGGSTFGFAVQDP